MLNNLMADMKIQNAFITAVFAMLLALLAAVYAIVINLHYIINLENRVETLEATHEIHTNL